tara:strand:- start:48 stop:509 length:462 start_codon:yes stop_codon:yes gene_type:complete
MRTVSGIEVTTVSTTAQFPVGEKFSVAQPASDFPAQTWIYVKAIDAFAVADIVMLDVAALGKAHGLQSTTTAQYSGKILGVAQHVIALGSFGFIQCGGVGEIKTTGTIGVGIGIIDSTTVGTGTAAGAISQAVVAVAIDATGSPRTALILCNH